MDFSPKMKRLLKDRVKLYAVSVWLADMAARLLFRRFSMLGFIYDLCAANAVILLNITCAVRKRKLEGIAAAYSVILFLLCVLECSLSGKGPGVARMAGVLSLLLPHCGFFTAKFFTLFRKTETGCGIWNDADYLFGFSKGLFAFYYPVSVALFLLIASGLFQSTVLDVFVMIPVLLILLLQLFRSSKARPFIVKKMDISATERRLSSPTRPQAERIIDLRMQGLYKRFCRYMDEKQPYLYEKCLIEEVARNLFTNRVYLSKMVNLCTGLNFSKLMNRYRVCHSVELYKKDMRLTVSDLSALSGFNNTVTYNLAFKCFMDIPPSEWCRLYRAAHISLEEDGS